MPGLVPGSTSLLELRKKDVDGRDKPGHDKIRMVLVGYKELPQVLALEGLNRRDWQKDK
jgi:hypothetical protein